jgi:hypothetical protein
MREERVFEGKVYVELVVDEQGNIQGVRCLKGIGGGCDQKGVRAVGRMNKWVQLNQRKAG